MDMNKKNKEKLGVLIPGMGAVASLSLIHI